MKCLLALVFLFVAVGCGSDTKDGTSGTDCPAGEEWNPILAQCELVDLPNNTGNNTSNNENNGNNANNENNANNANNANNGNPDMGEPDQFVDVCMDGFGSLIGKACAPSGEPLAAADVELRGVDCDGNEFTLMTRTGTDGNYTFDEVPHGTHNLRITIGSFDTASPVRVVAGMQTDLVTGAEKVCLNQNVEIAVIQGEYDHVEGLLTTLNLEHTIIGSDSAQADAAISFLTDLNAMMQYDIVFLNCGQYFGLLSPFGFQLQQIGTTIRQYVESGRSVYVSDWAHPFVEAAFPEMIEWYGPDETAVNDPRQGYAPQTITANVSSMVLESVLGAQTATIEYPQDTANMVFNDHWALPIAVGAGSETHLVGDAVLCNDDDIFNPCQQGQTQAAAPLLVTYKDPSGGSVVFTSFHNERQATLNQDMERILRFLIFSL